MKEKISLTIDSELLNFIDKKIDGKIYKNRSHIIERIISNFFDYNKPTKAVLLLGGKGTRLRPFTYEMPKALLPVHGKTVPEHLFKLFKRHGIEDIIFSVGYKADLIKEYFGDGSKFGVSITYVEEKNPAGSAGALKLAKKYLDGTFIVTNGDELKDINLYDMYDFHKQNKGLITIALTTVEDPSSYGVVKLQGNRIAEFLEKPQNAESNLIHSGLSIWEKEALDYIEEDKEFSMFEKDVFPKIVQEKKLLGYVFSGQWFDIGTPERYEKAIKEWQNK